MEFFFEIILIIVGRIFLGYTGYFVKLCWIKLNDFLFGRKKIKIKKSDFDDIIDVEDFENRLVGGLVLTVQIVLAVKLF